MSKTAAKTEQKAKKPAVSKTKAYDVIRSPLITEKATAQGSQGKVTFRVCVDATKSEIKSAVEQIFNVKVTKVNTINVEGKTKRFRGMEGKRNDFKKAVVTLAEGQNIDIMAGV